MSVRWLSNRWLSIVAAVLWSVLAFSTVHAGEAELRTWKSSSGKFEIEATFVEFASNDVGILVVVLKKKDGETIEVTLDKLSKADLDYVDSQEQASLNPSPAPLEESKPEAEERPEFEPGQSDEPGSELLDGKDGTDESWANDGWTEIDDVDWTFTSRLAKAALKTYSTAMKQHIDRSKQKAEQQRNKFVKVLEGIQHTLTEAGDLEKAVEVGDAAETLVKWHQIPNDKIAPIAVKRYRKTVGDRAARFKQQEIETREALIQSLEKVSKRSQVSKDPKEASRVRDAIAALRDGKSPPTKLPSTKRKKSHAAKVDVPE